jgi:hypothetical protein
LFLFLSPFLGLCYFSLCLHWSVISTFKQFSTPAFLPHIYSYRQRETCSFLLHILFTYSYPPLKFHFFFFSIFLFLSLLLHLFSWKAISFLIFKHLISCLIIQVHTLCISSWSTCTLALSWTPSVAATILGSQKNNMCIYISMYIYIYITKDKTSTVLAAV